LNEALIKIGAFLIEPVRLNTTGARNYV
jgi:hypothetical protein